VLLALYLVFSAVLPVDLRLSVRGYWCLLAGWICRYFLGAGGFIGVLVIDLLETRRIGRRRV